MANEKKVSVKKAWDYNLRAWKIYAKMRPKLFVSYICEAVLAAAVPYAGIWLSARFVDELAGKRDAAMLWKLAGTLLLTELVLGICLLAAKHWKEYCKGGLFYLDMKIYAEKFLKLDFPDMDDQHTQDLSSQIDQNRQWMGWGTENAIQGNLEKILGGGFQILGGVGLSFSLFTQKVSAESGLAFLNSPVLIPGIVACMLLITVFAPFCAKKSTSYWLKYAESCKMENRIFCFWGFDVPMDDKRALDMRIYRQDKIGEQYLAQDDAFSPNSQIARWAKGPMGLWGGMANGASVFLTGAAYLFVCLKAWGGAFGVGAVTQYVGALTKLFFGISMLMEAVANMQSNAEFLETNYEFLDIPNKMYQGSLTTEKRSDRQYEVEFKDVSFRYPGSDDWALRHVNLKFRVGQRLAVVGENGSGKTTFIKLLCRLYDPQEGEILLNGINIRKYRYDDYMKLFSVVFQDFWLLPETLGENVAGAAEYDRARARECLKEAGFEERLSRMPKGLDTCLYKTFDKDGVEVSGGEAQKIAIARALYHDKPFIVLDEPTAALDPIAEAEIYSKFNEIAGDKTAVYISHRLSSCKFCDEIAVFDHGEVVQKGAHEALLQDEAGKYYALWNAQAQYYVEKKEA